MLPRNRLYVPTATIHPRTDVDIVETTWDELHPNETTGRISSQWMGSQVLLAERVVGG